MEPFVDASCKLLLDGIDRVLQQVSARYDLNVDEVRREFLLPLIDQVPSSGVRFFAPRATSAMPAIKTIEAPKKTVVAEGPKCVARTIRGMCTRIANKPGCLCTLHFRLSNGPQEPPKEPVQEPPKESAEESVQEPPKEPVQEPVQEPAKEPAKEPVQEPVREPWSSDSSESSDSFDVGDIPEDIDFDAAFEEALRLHLPQEPEKKEPVASPQPKTIQEVLAQKNEFPEASQKDKIKKIKVKISKKV